MRISVTHSLLQGNKNLEHFGLSDSEVSNSNLNISSQPSTSNLNTGRSSTESSLYHVSLAEINPFLKAEALKENCRVGAVLNDSPEKTALEPEVEARAKPVKCNRLFSGSHEIS
jgi:hypothetical protein